MDNLTILIIGGAGYIGSHVVKMVQQLGYTPIVLDNLSRGDQRTIHSCKFIEGDMGNDLLLERIFLNHAIDVVMHFGAYIDVGESVRNPLLYYQNNIGQTMVLLEKMIKFGIKKLIFSSTAAIFGIPKKESIDERHPCQPINAYGDSKLTVERILQNLDQAHGLKFCCLRYFNAAGGDPDKKIKNYQRQTTNLIPLALKSLLAKKTIAIFGQDYPTHDGSCIRDYIHIEDLGTAHILGMKKLLAGEPSSAYNLGNGSGYSVKEVLRSIEQVTGQKLQIIESDRRPGDPAILIADSTKAREELGWQPRFSSLELMIEHAWEAFSHERA
jgi:UDP-glucose 4-epimerase